MKKAYQQGHGDGMCGLYSLLNFLHRAKRSEWKNANETLWYLLDATRQFGWLNPYTLTQGFETHQLKSIIDLQFSNYRMSYASYLLADLAEQLAPKNFYELAERVVSAGGSIIASWGSRDHWVLVTNVHDEIAVVDSSSKSEAAKPLSSRQRTLSLDDGLVILPKKRMRVEIDF